MFGSVSALFGAKHRRYLAGPGRVVKLLGGIVRYRSGLGLEGAWPRRRRKRSVRRTHALESPTRNQRVEGSSPSTPTNVLNGLAVRTVLKTAADRFIQTFVHGMPQRSAL